MHSDTELYTTYSRFSIHTPSSTRRHTREYFPVSKSINTYIKQLTTNTPKNYTHQVSIRLIQCKPKVYEILYKHNEEYILALEAIKIDNHYKIINYDNTFSSTMRNNKQRNVYMLCDNDKVIFYAKFHFKQTNMKRVKQMNIFYSIEGDEVSLVDRVNANDMKNVYVLLCEDLNKESKNLDLRVYYPMSRNKYVLNVVKVGVDEVFVEYKYPLKIGDVFFFVISLWNSMVP